jgi:mRNA interferase HigB
MDVRGVSVLEDFWTKHRDAESPLRKWMAVVDGAQWSDFTACRKTFASADQVKVRARVATVFNIKGNRYRLVAAIQYPLDLVVVRRVMTHEEYSENRWKEQL